MRTCRYASCPRTDHGNDPFCPYHRQFIATAQLSSRPSLDAERQEADS